MCETPDIVVPILRDRNGEETCGEPFSIGGAALNARGKEAGE